MGAAAMGGDAITVIVEGGCAALDPLTGGRHPVIAGHGIMISATGFKFCKWEWVIQGRYLSRR